MDSFSQGLERLCPVSGSVLHGIEPRLKDFHQLLLSPPKVEDRAQLWVPLGTLQAGVLCKGPHALFRMGEPKCCCSQTLIKNHQADGRGLFADPHLLNVRLSS